MDQDDVLFGNPKWLENFKKMKQAAVDPLYKDCPKHWTALRFNLQLLMMKSRHGYSGPTLASTTYYVCLLTHIQRVTTRCSPIPIDQGRWSGQCRWSIKSSMCGGKYEHLQSYPHNGMSRYKRNAGCHADVDDEGPKSRQNKKKKTAKQIPFPKDEEEEGCL